MKPLSRLFRRIPPPAPAPAPAPTLAQRIDALRSASHDLLVTIACGNDDENLRIAAVGLLSEDNVLRTLAGLATLPEEASVRTPPKLRLAAQERLAQLIDAGSIDFAAFCAGWAQCPEALAVAALCQDPERLHQALARIPEPSALMRIACDSPSSRVRQAAATAITDPAQLRELLQRLRGKDKAVYRIVKQKCDAHLAEQRHAEEFARETETLCTSLERLSKRTHDPLYAASLEHLAERWVTLPQRPPPEVEQRAQAAIEYCRSILAVRAAELAQQAAEQAARQAAAAALASAREAEQREAAERAEIEAQALAATADARESQEQALAEQHAAAQEIHHQIGSLIRFANEALRGGNSRRAARFRLELEEALKSAPAAPTYLTRRLQQLDEKLNELRQWKDYAVAPKRIELIDEMEALIGSPEEPAVLAERIRALQQEWRTVNQGIASGEPTDVERFRRAFQSAFKPCQEYFALQAAVRRENLEGRNRVLERLRAFEASQAAEPADRSLLGQVLREAPREWRSHSPVDRKAAQSLQVEFDHSMERLRGLQTAWFERHEADKRSLITQARNLATAEDHSLAIGTIQQLQVRWKETGPASRALAQSLWEEFRDLCDAVYKRRDEAHALQAIALDGAKSQAIALCEQIEQAASVPDTERASSKAKILAWRVAFEAIGDLPRAEANALLERFGRAVARYEASLAEQDRKDGAAATSKLFEAAQHIHAYERAVLQDAAPTVREALRSNAEAFIAAVKRWPSGGLQAVRQSLARAASACTPDYAARERALREVCIRAEILSATPTPPEDEALRRDFQMRLLMKGMGQVSATDDRDWDAMILEWIGIGAIAAETHERLQVRFLGSLAKRPAKGQSATPLHEQYRSERRGRQDKPGRSSAYRPR